MWLCLGRREWEERTRHWKWGYEKVQKKARVSFIIAEDVYDEADLDTQNFTYHCCQSSAVKCALVFTMCPQSTQSSHSYVPITPGHTNHSQEAVRTFRVSCQANEMWLSLCCQRTSSCSIHTASSDVWSLSQSQSSKEGRRIMSVCDMCMVAYIQTAECVLYVSIYLLGGLFLRVFRTGLPQWKR